MAITQLAGCFSCWANVKTGTLVDATIIAAASKEDGEARWVKHKGWPAIHGFKAHVGADANTALVEEVSVTPANVNDGKAGSDALPDQPGEVFADSAYRGKTFREAVRAKGGSLRVAVTGVWGRDEAETLARLEAWNQPIHRIRGRIEKIYKPSYFNDEQTASQTVSAKAAEAAKASRHYRTALNSRRGLLNASSTARAKPFTTSRTRWSRCATMSASLMRSNTSKRSLLGRMNDTARRMRART